MYETIVLPTDGSEGLATVADHAGTLAREHGGTIHVLSVADTRNRFESPSSGIAPEIWRETEQERAEAAADAAVDALPSDVPVERHVESGVPHSGVVDYAESVGADVIVMGTHGRTGLDHYLIGSVAERVVRQSPVPVLTIGIDEESPADG